MTKSMAWPCSMTWEIITIADTGMGCFLSLGRKWEGNFYSCLDWKEMGRKNLYFRCGKEKEGKERGEKLYFVSGGK